MRRRVWTARTYFPDLRVRMAEHRVSSAAMVRQLDHKSPAQFSRWLNGRVAATAESLERCEVAFGQLIGKGGPG